MENENKTIPVTEGAKVILNTIKDEFFPIQRELKELLKDIQGCRIRFSIYSKKITSLNKRYIELSIKFFDIAIKLETPDILFNELKNNPDENMSSYFQFKEALEHVINDGFKYIEIIDRSLDRKMESIQNSRTLVLASIAIVVSLISFM